MEPEGILNAWMTNVRINRAKHNGHKDRFNIFPKTALFFLFGDSSLVERFIFKNITRYPL